MGLLSVVAAAAAAWIFGAVWYGLMGQRWMLAAGLTEDSINRGNIIAFVGSFLGAVLVAGMIRHIFATSAVTTVGAGLVSGLGLGLFLVTPWIATNYLFAQRPVSLILIDGVYATVGCALIGAVLVTI